MKHLISDNGGYRTFVEVIKPDYDVGSVQVKISSQYSHSKNPEEFQTRFEGMFTPAELDKIKEVLSLND